MLARHPGIEVRFPLLREATLMIGAFLAYFLVRHLTEGSRAEALDHAQWLIRLERAIGVLWEPTLQRAIIGDQRLVTLANVVYIWGHWPVIVVTAVWLFQRRPATYVLFRNAFLISGGIGLLFFAFFPVAPPRLADLDIIDTVTRHSRAYRVLQPPAFTNAYAALPSLHFGWDLLIGIALVKEGRAIPLKLLGWALPLAMLLATVVTANHYILDVVAGAVVALVGLLLAVALQTARSRANYAAGGKEVDSTCPS